jgi:hypothetical protein
MSKPLFDQEELIAKFASASAKGSAQLRKAASEATLKALQGRELTLKNIQSALKQVSDAASQGAAKNMGAGVDVPALLAKAAAGMDDALLKAVEANRAALSQFVNQGADLREKHLKKAVDDLEKFEDAFFAALKKTAAGASAPLAGAWNQVLEKMQSAGTVSGAQAHTTAEQMLEQAQSAMRASRAASLKAAQALAESYAAMVSGVLVGMSEALHQAKADAPAAKRK